MATKYAAAIERARKIKEEEGDNITVPSLLSFAKENDVEKGSAGKYAEAIKRMQLVKSEMKEAEKRSKQQYKSAVNYPSMMRTQEEIQKSIADTKKQAKSASAENVSFYQNLVKGYEDELAMRKDYDYQQKYGSLSENADFEEKSQYKKTANGGKQTVNPFTGSFVGSGFDYPMYDAINGNPEAIQEVRNESRQYDPYALTGEFDLEEFQINEEEKKIFNYLYNTQGRDAASEYLEYIQDDLYKREREAEEEKAKEYAEKHPVSATIGTIAASPLKGLAMVGSVLDYATTGKIDPNKSYNKYAYTSGTARETVSNTVEKKWGKVGSFAYDIGMSMGDMLVASGLTGGTGLGVAILGASAAADTTLDALDRGVSSGRALLLGVGAGVIEAVTEKFALDKLFDKTVFKNWTKDGIKKYIFSNILTEAGEEAASEIANTLADAFISQDQSYWMQTLSANMDQGDSRGAAITKAVIGKIGEVGLAALGGALSGGTLAGGSVALNAADVGIQKEADNAADRKISYTAQDIIRKAQQEETASQRREEQKKYTVLPTAVDLEKAKARARGDVFDIGYEKPYTGYANTAEEEELQRAIDEAETITEKTGLRHGASTEAIREALEIGRALGRDVEFFTQKSADGKTVKDGFYSSENGHIYVNVNAKKPVATVISHELTHSYEGTSTYSLLEDLAKEAMERRGKTFDEEIDRVRKLYEDAGVSYASESDPNGETRIRQEIVAKYVEKDVLGSKRAVLEIAKESPSFAYKLRRWLNNLLAKLSRNERSSQAFAAVKEIANLVEEVVAEMEAEQNAKTDRDATAEEAPQRTKGETSRNEQIPVKKEKPVTEAPERSERVQEKPETKKAPVKAETKTEAKESTDVAEDTTDTVMLDDAEEFMVNADERYAIGEITEEEYREAVAYYDEWVESGKEPTWTSEGFEEGVIPKIARKVAEKAGLSWSVSEINGEGVVVVRQADVDDLMNYPGESVAAKVRAFLTRKFRNTILPIGETDRAYIRREGTNEYTNPAKRLPEDIYNSKMKAASDFDELLAVSKFKKHVDDDGRHPDAVRGWNYYTTKFLVQEKNGKYEAFEGTVKIKLISRGDCFYDITEIKNISDSTAGQALIKAAGSVEDVSENSISKNTKAVNRESKNNSDLSFSVEYTDAEYMEAVGKGDTETAKRMVEAAASSAMPNSKLRLPDGRLRMVYHGTNTGDFTEFNPDYIGMSSGDDGFFGMGFYFAYSKGEASYYGSNRVISAFVNVENPFDFEQELQMYNGEKASSGHAPDAVAIMNFAEKFPEIAENITIGVVKANSDDVIDLPIKKFAKEFRKVIETKSFEYTEVKNEFGEPETLVTADPENVTYKSGDKTYSYRDYGFQKRFWGTPNKLDVAYEYLSTAVYQYIDMLPRTRLVLDNNREFTNALKEKGYDGTIQSQHGDEVVAFYPNQIKSADPVVYDDDGNVVTLSERFDPSKNDIRWSVEEAPSDAYEELPSKAKTALRKIETSIGKQMDEAMGLNLAGEDGRYRTEEFKQFISDVVRPITSEFLTTGMIQMKTVMDSFDKVRREGGNETLGAFQTVLSNNWDDLSTVRRYAEQSKREEAKVGAMEPISREDAKKRFEALKDAQKHERKMMRTNLLTEEDMLEVGKLLRREIGLESIDAKKHNKEGIRAVYEAKRQTIEAKNAVDEYKRRIKARQYAEADELLETMMQWKDKKAGILYQRETMERNLQDVIPDKEIARTVTRDLVAPVHKHEADAIRWKNKLKNRIKELNISTKKSKDGTVSEAYAVQFWGEANDNIKILEALPAGTKRDGFTLDEWRNLVENMWKENKNIDKDKIKKAAAEFRKIYEEIFEEMNNVLLDNGYPPISYRQGYFPHFTGEEETILARFGRAMGIKTEMTALPTTINGMTENFKPGKPWFGHAQERQGYYTTYDALTGFEQYIKGAADVIFHTEDIQRFRALANRIRYNAGDEGVQQKMREVENNTTMDDAQKEAAIHELMTDGKFALSNFVAYLDEYTNKLANKKSRLDRNVESLFGRKIYTIVNNLESRVAANMIAANLGSALTNFIPVNQAASQIGWRWMLKGMQSAVANMRQSDGLSESSSFLVNRSGYDPIVKTMVDQVSDIAGKPMELIDTLASEMIVRAAYAQNLNAGMTEEEALYQADLFASSVMADRSKGSMPLIFESKNPIMKLFTQFQLEVNNEFSVILKDIPRRERKKWTDAVALVLFKYFLGAFLYNELYELIVGRRAALDPIGIGKNVYKGFRDGKKAKDVLGNAATEAIEQLPFVGGLMGGGRVPIQSAIPDVANIAGAAVSTWDSKKKAQTIWKEASKPLWYVLLPFGGGAIKKLAQGIDTIARGGKYSVDTEGRDVLQYPFFKDQGVLSVAEGARAIAFGTTSTMPGQEWVESGFGSLGAKQTAVYQSLIEEGVGEKEAYQFIKELSSVKSEKAEGQADGDSSVKSKSELQREMLRKSGLTGDGKAIAYFGLMAGEGEQILMERVETLGADMGTVTDILMEFKDAESTAEKIELLMNANLTDDVKKMIYEDRISESRSEDVVAFYKAGMDYDDFLACNKRYNELYNNKELSASEKATLLSRFIRQKGYDSEKKAVIEEAFTYYQMIPAQASRYDAFTEAGLEDETAYQLTTALGNLEPEEGKSSVSNLQKYRAVVDTVASPVNQMDALSAIMTEQAYTKTAVAYSYKIEPETYVTYLEELGKYDKDENGSLSQVEVETALRTMAGKLSFAERMTIELTGGEAPGLLYLSDAQLAVLWQLSGVNWSPKNNPYSVEIGEKVQAALKKK